MNNDKMQVRSDNTLENLSPDARENILELAASAPRLADIIVALKEQGINVSRSTLSRFLQRDRQAKVLAERKDARETVEELAAGAKDGRLRMGTLEAVRQRLYERALVSQNPEEALELFAAMVKEEGKLRELELEERRVAIAEEELKVKAMVARAKLGERIQAEVVETKELGNHGEENENSSGGLKQIAEVGPSENERRLKELVSAAAVAILNRGGDLGERMLETRGLLTEGLSRC